GTEAPERRLRRPVKGEGEGLGFRERAGEVSAWAGSGRGTCHPGRWRSRPGGSEGGSGPRGPEGRAVLARGWPRPDPWGRPGAGLGRRRRGAGSRQRGRRRRTPGGGGG